MRDRRAHVEGLLLFHRPIDDVERAHKAEMLKLLAAGGDVFDRSRTEPGHFTASAFVVSADLKELLLIHHPKLARWLQPGGHVELTDPDVVFSARREVAEEVGLTDVECDGRLFDVDVHPIPGRRDEGPHNHYDLRFLVMSRRKEFTVGDGVREAKWVPIDEVQAVTTDESVLRAVRRMRLG